MYPTAAMVLVAYGFVGAEFMIAHPGQPMLTGVRDHELGAILSALGAAANYPGDVFHKGAVLFRSLVKNHALFDGNKRTAVLVTFMFLRRNGFDPNAPAQRWTNTATAVASANGPYSVDPQVAQKVCSSRSRGR